MTQNLPPPIPSLIPETAPFSEEQRVWLNGFFAGLVSLDGFGVTPLSGEQAAVLLSGGASGNGVDDDDGGAPWHDQTLPLAERMNLANGKPLRWRMGCLFLGKAGTIPQWDSIKTIFEGEALSEPERRAMLSGKSTKGIADPGPLVCACFGVGLNVIRAALASGRAASVEQIGVALRAGTNCGSFLPELKRIVADDRVAQTA